MQPKDTPTEQFSETIQAAAAAVGKKGSKRSAARVQELKAKFLSGDYMVDAKDIARKLIDEHLS